MGIFKNITKTLKQAAPFIGGSIGFAFGGPMGAALGSGIGSLVGGGDTEDALTAAALGGLAGYAGSKFFGPAQGTKMATSPSSFGFGAEKILPTKIASVTPMASSSFFTSPTGIATLGLGAAALGGLGEEEKKAETTMQPYPVGKSRLGMGRIGNKFYDLNDEDERRQYFEDLRNRNKDKDKEDDEVGIMTVAAGGEVKGPGTGTSDSVPARLSDGEFVLTAKAVRGAGGGDRDLGAARMYDMMSELERVA